jgi:hypothetical protein
LGETFENDAIKNILHTQKVIEEIIGPMLMQSNGWIESYRTFQRKKL